MTGYSVIDGEPSERFPVYTRGNAGEVYPNVMTPLTGSLIGDASSDGQMRAMQDLGMVIERDFRGPGDVGTGVFGGYLYGNLSLMRVACYRAPGLTAADADRQVAGLSADAPPHVRRRGDRSVTATLRTSWVMGTNLLRADIEEVNRARVATDRWRQSIPDPASRSDAELLELVAGSPPRFADGMRLLLTYSGYAAGGGAMMERFADQVKAPPGTAASLTGGLGTIDSASPALRLWKLGRQVAASPALTAFFDAADGFAGAGAETRAGAGAGRALAELAAGSEDGGVAEFVEGFGEFLTEHGARGPDEWELASPTWGTNPEIALAAIDRLRHAPDARDPIAAGRRLADERKRVTHDVRQRLPRPVRPVFDRLARAARLYAEGRERAKAVFIDDNYTLRCALFELAARTAQRGGPVERRDFFLVTAEELPAFVADPEPFTAVIDERRRQRDHLQARRPPFVFVGQIPDPSTWPLRDPPRDDAASDGSGEPDRTDGSVPTGGSGGSGPAGGSGRLTSGTTLEGQGVCPGTTRGVVRVVRDPADPRALGPGDILVAPITDPAWTPLFLAVAGVVVEVGAQQSHAAIVARELGIPAIVGVADATTRLADGQLIEIDGATGVVTIV